MVGLDCEFKSKEVMLEGFAGPRNGESLFLNLGVPLFRQSKSRRYVRNGSHVAVRLLLTEDSA